MDFLLDFFEFRVIFIGLTLLDFGTGRNGVLLYAVFIIFGFSGYTCRVETVFDGLKFFKDGKTVTVVAAIFFIYYLLTSLKSSLL